MNIADWNSITNRVILLTLKWHYWKELFSASADTVRLNRMAPSCFAMIQESMLADVLTSIARLVDPPGTGTKTNLVLETLLSDIKSGTTRAGLATQLTSLRSTLGPIIAIRHKVLAHEDKSIATGVSSLPNVDHSDIDNAIHAIGSLMRQMEEAAGATPHTYAAPELFGSGKTVHWLLEQAYPNLVKAESYLPSGASSPVPGRAVSARIWVRDPL